VTWRFVSEALFIAPVAYQGVEKRHEEANMHGASERGNEA